MFQRLDYVGQKDLAVEVSLLVGRWRAPQLQAGWVGDQPVAVLAHGRVV